MAKGSRWAKGKEVVAEMLRAGLTVTPKALMDRVLLDPDEQRLYRMWVVNYTRSLVHEVGKDLEMTIMAVGDGKGYKQPETPEEWEEAQRRTDAAMRGQYRRKKAIKQQRKDPNQNYLPLEEAPIDADTNAPARQPAAASA